MIAKFEGVQPRRDRKPFTSVVVDVIETAIVEQLQKKIVVPV